MLFILQFYLYKPFRNVLTLSCYSVCGLILRSNILDPRDRCIPDRATKAGVQLTVPNSHTTTAECLQIYACNNDALRTLASHPLLVASNEYRTALRWHPSWRRDELRSPEKQE